MAPLVSVIVPTRRPPGRGDLDRAVRSALAQTWPALDVWVIDDGSDPPARLAPGLAADPRVHLVRLPEARGPGPARNVGIERSAGALIAFLDDDDAWLPDKTARQVAALARRGPEVGGIACAARVSWDGRPPRLQIPPPEDELERALLHDCLLRPSTVVLRRAALAEVGAFDATLARTEDWDLWLRLTDRFALAVLPDVLVEQEVAVLAPEDSLRYRRLAEERLGPRIERLPPRERDAVRASHLFARGLDLARLGERTAARRAFLAAWRRNPRWLRPLAHVPRTVIGERAWEAGRRGPDLVRRAPRAPSPRPR
jgi:glycosyltransferase involved in cell wall biosynthesis